MRRCRHCGTAVPYDEPIPRDAECATCGKDLRACVQCRHYDPAYHNACRETMADPVVEKERRNFCEYFSFSRASFRPAAESARQSDARAKLDSLFGGQGKAAQDPRRRLDHLFRKPDSGE